MSKQAQGCRLFPIYFLSKGKDHRDRDWIDWIFINCSLKAELASKNRGESGVTCFWGASSSRSGRRWKWWESWVRKDAAEQVWFSEDLTMIWNWKHCQVVWCEILRNVHVACEARLNVKLVLEPKIYSTRLFLMTFSRTVHGRLSISGDRALQQLRQRAGGVPPSCLLILDNIGL